ncbi:MAG: tRNA lysidine(34) synthetase TilS [Actinomycetota bacterium]|nr:tRNA lysidine(34) synthetase TilS [Actinomycetota bacterium]
MVRALESVQGGALIALSGGPDSTALTYLVSEARPDLKLSLGHVRHGLREDDVDVATVHRHAEALKLPLAIAEIEVRPSGEGLEAAARVGRHAALRRLASEAGVAWILLGHTADDQAETVLLRVARGTGITGLAGMRALRGDLVRPLLRIRRSDVRRFVALEGLDAAEDPTNRDPASRRVRVRQTVLPALETLAPDPVGALVRLADLARVDATYLEAEAARVARSSIRPYGPARALSTELLAGLDVAVASRVVRRLLAAVRGSTPVNAGHVDAVLALQAGQARDLPGVIVTRGGGWLAAAPPELPEAGPVTLAVPGVTNWTPAAVSIVAVTGSDSPVQPHDLLSHEALPPGGNPALGSVALGGLQQGDLVVRSRRQGDRVTARAGTRKLQDLFVDAGIPRAVRDLVPVVTLGDRLLWVPGVTVDVRAESAGRITPTLHLAVTARDQRTRAP